MQSSSFSHCSRTPLALGISILAFCLALPALAADIAVTSKIDTVTVYPNGAQVTRVAEVDIPAGSNVFVFKGLPIGLDVNSLRVRALGGDKLVIGSVESRVAPAQRTAEKSSIAEKLQSLKNERTLLTKQMAALQAKKRMIELYAKASPQKLGEKTGPLNVADWGKAWDAVGQGLARNAEEVQAAQLRWTAVTKEINALSQSNRRAGSGAKARRTVSVDLEAPTAGKTRLTLTYRIRGARWRPVYDARLTTAGKDRKASLQMIRRASVRQRTGEDWSGVVLKVSTVRSNRGTQAPDLLAQRLEFYNPPPPSPVAKAPQIRREYRKQRGGLLSMHSADSRAALGAAKPAAERAALVQASAYEARFQIKGRVDLKSDNSARLLLISSSTIVPELMVHAVPALNRTAYLEAAFVNKDEAPYLPGIVNIHRDGNYAGRGRIRLAAPGARVRLGFGADDSVQIKRVPVNRKKSGPGWVGNNSSEVKDFKTSITNLHGFAIKVRIHDRMPISEDDKIVIKPLSSNSTASQTNVDGRRGVMAWQFDLKAKATKDIRFGWQVAWPEGKRIVPRNLRN